MTRPAWLAGRRAWIAAAALVAALVVAGSAAWRERRGDAGSSHGARGASSTRAEFRAPPGVRVRVQVVNATKTRGLARRATQFLRDRGFDVVEVGTSSQLLDSVVVLDRSGHLDWAQLVADALGGARVEARPDSSRYLDVTVLLGASWRAPSKPLYP